MRIASVYSLSPIRFERKKKDEVLVYQRNEIDRLFRELLIRGYVFRAYTLYSKAIRSLKVGDLLTLRKILREMKDLIYLKPEEHVEQNKVRKEEEDRITLVDSSNDLSVSFKYPASVPAFASELFITAHEGEHARRILRMAILKGERAQVLVRVFFRYDSRGRLIAVGGLTSAEVYESTRKKIFEAVA